MPKLKMPPIPFAPIPDVDENIEEKVGKQGFQAGLFDKFTKLSLSGKELMEHIIQDVQEKEKEKQIFFMEYMETLKKEIMTLMKILNETEEQQQDQRQASQQEAALISQQLAKNAVPTDIKPTEQSKLSTELFGLNDIIGKKEQQYKDYDDNIDKAEQFIEKLPPNRDDSIKSLKAEIARLEGTEQQAFAEVDKIDDLIAQGKDDEAHRLSEARQARVVQVAALKDMLSVAEGSKKMYGQDGNPTDSYKEARFIVPADQKLVKEGSDYFLLNALPRSNDKEPYQFPPLSADNKAQAGRDFQKAMQQKEISCVRDVIDSNKSIEMRELSSKVESIQQRIEALPQARSQFSAIQDSTHHHAAPTVGADCLKSQSDTSRDSSSPDDEHEAQSSMSSRR